MSLSFGGLGLISLWTPLYFWDDSAHARSEFRSFVFALVFVAVVLILAYLTNPSETSFRAYLTEQSFRQHLSHLDDATDDSSDTDTSYPSPRSRFVDRNTLTDRTPLPFHFANHASVSLRTPKHVFHSFGICTIATTRGAVGANGRNSSSTSAHGSGNLADGDHDGSVVSDSWFIGAYGHWWRGGLVESWYQDAMIRSKDAEGWSSGILGFKALDKLNELNGLPFAKSIPFPRLPSRGTPPRLRNRERFVPRLGLLPRRNSTPPPLPKSASLPLHTNHRTHERSPPVSQPLTSKPDQTCLGVHAPPAQTISRSPSRSVSIDHSPIIAEVLRQITSQQALVSELDNQVSDVQKAATVSHDALEVELVELRLRKRDEDQRKAEGKTRAKILEDARRSAESGRRDAEKKLKAARGVKDDAVRRIDELEGEIGRLREQIEADRATLHEEADIEVATLARELQQELEVKRKEVRVAEDVVAALSTRATELENKITEARERLRAARERTEAKHEPMFVPMQVLGSSHSSTHEQHSHINGHGNAHDYDPGHADAISWSSTFSPFDDSSDTRSSPGTPEHAYSSFSTNSRDFGCSPRPPRLSLGSLSNFSPNTSETSAVSLRSKGFAVVGDDVAPLAHTGQTSHGYFSPQTTSKFSPFDVQTPSSAFIPSSLISMLDSPSGEWRGIGRATGALSASPVSLNAPSSASEVNIEHDQFTQTQALYDRMGMPYRTNSDPSSVHALDNNTLPNGTATTGLDSGPRRWFSTSAKDKQRRGLNPDAKVFRLPRRKAPATSEPTNAPPTASYDALNPTGLMTNSTSSTPSALLRAFAPSRAEREVLQRALGGSTNTSLERLPSLSDVGSIPSSPVHAHAEAQPVTGFGGKESALPAWLQSLPLIRKPNFSPWDDEEPVSASTGGDFKRK